jgi:hypothetical protein
MAASLGMTVISGDAVSGHIAVTFLVVGFFADCLVSRCSCRQILYLEVNYVTIMSVREFLTVGAGSRGRGTVLL